MNFQVSLFYVVPESFGYEHSNDIDGPYLVLILGLSVVFLLLKLTFLFMFFYFGMNTWSKFIKFLKSELLFVIILPVN